MAGMNKEEGEVMMTKTEVVMKAEDAMRTKEEVVMKMRTEDVTATRVTVDIREEDSEVWDVGDQDPEVKAVIQVLVADAVAAAPADRKMKEIADIRMDEGIHQITAPRGQAVVMEMRGG